MIFSYFSKKKFKKQNPQFFFENCLFRYRKFQQLAIRHNTMHPTRHLLNFFSDLITQYCLSEDFCKQHFLVGVLLQEVRASLNEIPHVRKIALGILKDLMAKHEFDDRYQNKGQLQRIAMLYIPWLVVVLENFHR